MADAPLPLVFLEGDADGICDAETGVCAVPEAAAALPVPGESETEPGDQARSGSPAAR